MDAWKKNIQTLFQLRAQSRIQEALELYQQIQDQASLAEQQNELGVFCLQLGNPGLAGKHFQEALKQNPENVAYLNNIALALMELGQHEQALGHLHKAQELAPKDVPTQFNLGVIFQNQDQIEEAIQAFQNTIALAPDAVSAHVGLATALDKALRTTEAKTVIQKIHNPQKPHAEVIAVLADFLLREQNFKEADELLSLGLAHFPNAYKLHFALGNLRHKQKRFDEAWQAFCKANELSDRKLVKTSDFLSETTELLKSYEQTKSYVSVPVKLSGPIYVVGAPRSGTTLLAQMLGMHSQITNAGECTHLRKIMALANQNLGNPNNVARIWQQCAQAQNAELLTKLQNTYKQWQQNTLADSHKSYFVDKLPSNARRMGLINLLEPQAPVIHIIRDGREVALSAFMQNFRAYVWHSHNLENALLDWKTSIELARAGAKATGQPYYEIFYENLVQNPTQELQKLFTFLNIPFEQACLEFDQNKTLTFTASYQQVRQKLFKSSLNKAQNYPEQYKMMTEKVEGLLRELNYLS